MPCPEYHFEKRDRAKICHKYGGTLQPRFDAADTATVFKRSPPPSPEKVEPAHVAVFVDARKAPTTLFSDPNAWTAFSTKRDAKEANTIANRTFGQTSTIIVDYKDITARCAGEAIIAAFAVTSYSVEPIEP